MKKTKKYFMLTLGSFLTALGLDVFLIPFKMSIGGVSGLGALFYLTLGIPTALSVLILNFAIFVIGIKYLEKENLWYSAYSALLLSLFLYLCEFFPTVSSDKLLNSLFGGAAIGCGIGIVASNGAATGGTDLIALMINKNLPHISIGSVICVIDLAVIFITTIVFLDFSIALYCALALFVSARVTDYIVGGVDYSKSVLIVSDKHREISENILRFMNRGVTGITSEGMYSKNKFVTLMCVVKPREVTRLKNIVKNADKKAFVIISDVSQTLGEGFRENF